MFAFQYSGRNLGHMAQPTDELSWNADNVAALMFRHNLASRAALAKNLGVSRSVVNTAFDANWQGRATTHMIARLATHFRVPIAHLVIEPVIALNRMKAVQK